MPQDTSQQFNQQVTQPRDIVRSIAPQVGQALSRPIDMVRNIRSFNQQLFPRPNIRTPQGQFDLATSFMPLGMAKAAKPAIGAFVRSGSKFAGGLRSQVNNILLNPRTPSGEKQTLMDLVNELGADKIPARTIDRARNTIKHFTPQPRTKVGRFDFKK